MVCSAFPAQFGRRLLCRSLIRKALAATAILAGVALSASSASAAMVPVGTGPESAPVVLNFSDGTIAEFLVAYNTPTTTGEQLIRTMVADLPNFTITSTGTGGSFFLTGMNYAGHTNGPAYVAPDGWWHYWIRPDSTSAWTMPQTFGAGTRTVDNGYQDGWVFGSAAAPVPEPACVAGLSAMTGLLTIRRRTTRRRDNQSGEPLSSFAR